jgi:hypothetical protein
MGSTDLLIQQLANDHGVRPPLRAGRVLAAWWLAGAMATAALVATGLGLRPDLAHDGVAALTAAKALAPLLCLALAAGAVIRLMRPENTGEGWLQAAVVVFAGLATVWAMGGLSTTAPLWPSVKGQTLGACLVLIPLLSLPPLAAGIVALRQGAPSQPALAGAWVGLGSGGIAAALYALHCTEDSPLFHLAWYTVGIAVAAGIGALAGHRWARW